jgi:hypothetical protein
MIIEPTATTIMQITGNSSSTATTPARPLRVLFAKRQPATPIRKLRLAPSSSGLTLSTQSARLTIANSGVPLDQGEEIVQSYCQGERCFCGKARRAQGRGNDLLRRPAADPPPAHELHLVQRIGLTHAVRIDGRGRRTPLTVLRLSVRDHFLQAAADIYCTGMSDRAAAAWLHKRLARYRECAWRRDRALGECPPRLAGRINAVMWCVLKCSDRLVSERLIRAVLSRSS